MLIKHPLFLFEIARIIKLLKTGILFSAFIPTIVFASESSITKYSIEELMSMEITSVSKKCQQVSKAAASIYVISQTDIKNSGLLSIPEILRLVPGLQVAQINGSNWAISARGFNGRWSNKLLVLMDGRTLYTPTFSGVYWDAQDTNIDDIERIEVIKGPGASVWGANAVNGVINIITKQSQDTLGGYINLVVGNEQLSSTMRFGSAIGANGRFRIFAKATDNNATDLFSGGENHDAWDTQRVGFRSDWTLSKADELTIQGDSYKADAEQLSGWLEDVHSSTIYIKENAQRSGYNTLFRWRHTNEDNSSFELQGYMDNSKRESMALIEDVRIYDIEFQHRFNLTNSQELTWGANYRQVKDELIGSFIVSFNPNSREIDLYGAFIQDEITLNEEVIVTLGSKLEHNDYTGYEILPSARFLWAYNDTSSFWGAYSRSVRTPARANIDIQINAATISSPYIDFDGPFGPLNAGDPALISIVGSPDVDSEVLYALEGGYKGIISDGLSIDLSIYYNRYNKLLSNHHSMELGGDPLPTHAVLLSRWESKMKGKSHGFELSSSWFVNESLKITAGYSWLAMSMKLQGEDLDQSSVNDIEKGSPKHQLKISSNWKINDNLSLNLIGFYVDELFVRDTSGVQNIKAYTRFDANIQWYISPHINVQVAGQNIFTSQHREFVTTDIISSEIQQSIYASVKVKF